MHEIIISPIASEKTTLNMEKENTLTFLVDRRATKPEIKKEVETRFQVKVIDIRTMIFKGGKKAIVRLSSDNSADEISGRIGVF
ncbi:MAG: 50S ribosomal protein L23 [Candidatus Thermoplasmatota archaeon]|nr:50S ribosomal protein L23 [Candidatus Thermoplasmatota archaeon]